MWFNHYINILNININIFGKQELLHRNKINFIGMKPHMAYSQSLHKYIR